MRAYLDGESQYCEVDKIFHIGTFGGECNFDDLELSSYGIQLGCLTVDNLTPEQMKTLGVAIINHLGVNGHRFELGRHQDGQYIKAL